MAAASGEDVEQPFLGRYRNQDDGQRKRRIMAGIFCLIIAILLLGISIIILQNNSTLAPGFQIDSAMVSLSPKNPNASANWTIGMSVKNRSKRSTISYDEFGISVFQNGSYEYINHHEVAITPFSQNPGDLTAVTAAGTKGLVSMIVDMKNSSRIRIIFNVKMKIRLKYMCPVCLEGLSYVKGFKCMDVNVVSANANELQMVGGPRKCNVIDWRDEEYFRE